jgi:Leucine-rich repeat (LRR) protein
MLLFIGLVFWSCEEDEPEDCAGVAGGDNICGCTDSIATNYESTATFDDESCEYDTTPPTVTVTFPQNNSSVFEIVSITCISSDNEGVEKLELWVNGVTTGLTDNSEPYSFEWNTTTLEDGNYTIIIRSYDTSSNTADSEPLVLTVDNSLSVPQGGNVTSVTYTTTEMTVEWEQSSDGDFKDYKLLYSETESGNKDTIQTYTDISTTSYTITEFDPTHDNWFWVQVTDTLGFSSIGTGMTNSLDSEPNPVDVTSVTYDLESMTITWEEYVPNMGRIQRMNQNTRSTVTNDFVSYELLQSDNEDGTYVSVAVITDQSITSHVLTEYDPTHENWFKVKVTDFWELNSTGTGTTNDIDSPPTQVDISSVTYDLTEMVITWNQSNDNDFVSYELLQSDTSVTVITDLTTTSHSITEYNPMMENWFKVKVTDFWGLNSIGNGMTNEIESTPPIPSVLYPISWNGMEFQISWSQNNDDDFQSYKLYESLSEDITNQTLIYETDDRTDTTYFKTIQNFRYYQITSEDVWGLQSTSNIEAGDYYIELWGESYSVPNTTYLVITSSGLTGSIPPEIGNLTNLTNLWLSSNQLTGSIPSEIGNLVNLEYLRLHHNQLTGEIPSEIGNLTNLVVLSLYNNQLTGEIPSEIGNLTNLEKLYLYDNQLTGEIPSEIGNLTNLTNLWLSSNQLSGIIPDEICNQGDSSPLLFGNQFCPSYPSCIENSVGEQDWSNCEEGIVELWGEYYSIEYTTELNLYVTQLTDSIPPEIGNLTNLTQLMLGYNGLTGSIPSEIGNLVNLEYLSLYQNPFTGEIPPEIGNLTNLTYLSLWDTQLTGSIPPEIGNLTNLTNLRLYSNHLTDSIPPEIWNLTNLTELNLSRNYFTTGFIPPEIGNLTNLTGLKLNHNELTGSIPSEIGNLTNLHCLDLSYNELTGEIPESICFPSYISWHYPSSSISNNQLCPPYPSCIEDYVGEQDTSDCP